MTPENPGTTWQAMVDHLPTGAALLDTDLRVLHVNERLLADMDRASGDVVGSVIHSLVSRRMGTPARPGDFQPGKRQRYELLTTQRRHRVEASLVPLPTSPAMYLWMIHDTSVTDDGAISGLEASETGFALALRGAADGIWEWNPVTKNLFLSPRLLSIFGYPSDFAVKTTDDWLELVHPEDREKYNEANTRHLRGESPHFECEYRIRRADGTWAWGLSRGIAHFDDDGVARRMAGSITDISERKHQEELIRLLATRDTLTGLANRFLLGESLAAILGQARESGEPVAVVYLDLDNFKNINDSLGHQVGDAVLQEIARRLQLEFPPPEVVARQGGDEFIVVIPQAGNPASIGGRIGTLLEILRQPISIDGGELVARASAGIVFYPTEAQDAATLLKNADLALYAAKNRGRGQFAFFDGAMAQDAAERLTLERHLSTAIERDELFLEYQPQVDIINGRLTGCEALLRWRHPKLGLISPARFIPVAESTGLIVPVGMWVIDEACRQAAALRAAGFGLPVAVNLSVAQLTNSDLIQTVLAALGRHHLPPEAIELEITESLLMDGGSEAMHALEEIHQLGIPLSVDDFGTGYSSLAYLKDLPISKLKIDRSFVKGVDGNRGDVAVIRAIIAIAQELDLSIIAEGVETRGQAAALADLGCTRAQGFLYSRPLVPADLLAFLTTTHSRT